MEIIFGFMLGAVLSSFSNCVAYRYLRKLDFIKEHSKCMNCNHQLGVLDLVPVFSCIFLSAKCRYCGSYFGWEHCFFETLLGIVFACIIFRTSLIYNTVIYLSLSWLIYFIIVMLFEYFRLKEE